MPTRPFPNYDLTQLFKNMDDYQDTDDEGNPDGPLYTLIECGPTGDIAANTDRLGEWHYLVFEVEGVTYRCFYVDGTAYWRAESGDSWDDYFPVPPKYGHDFPERYTRDNNDILCTVVVKKEVVTHTWEPEKD